MLPCYTLHDQNISVYTDPLITSSYRMQSTTLEVDLRLVYNISHRQLATSLLYERDSSILSHWD